MPQQTINWNVVDPRTSDSYICDLGAYGEIGRAHV